MVGNENDNTIIAGRGDSSLWGGNIGDDLLIGGAAKNTFFYCLGNGNDTIQGANNGDVVMLSGISIDEISSTEITSEGVTLNFIDGGQLNIDGTFDITYRLGDGTKYSANHETSSWQN